MSSDKADFQAVGEFVTSAYVLGVAALLQSSQGHGICLNKATSNHRQVGKGSCGLCTCSTVIQMREKEQRDVVVLMRGPTENGYGTLSKSLLI